MSAKVAEFASEWQFKLEAEKQITDHQKLSLAGDAGITLNAEIKFQSAAEKKAKKDAEEAMNVYAKFTQAWFDAQLAKINKLGSMRNSRKSNRCSSSAWFQASHHHR